MSECSSCLDCTEEMSRFACGDDTFLYVFDNDIPANRLRCYTLFNAVILARLVVIKMGSSQDHRDEHNRSYHH